MQELIPKYPGENRVSYIGQEGGPIYDVWLDAQQGTSSSITISIEQVIKATDPCDWCQDYYAPDGRTIRARIRDVLHRVPISSWQDFLNDPESVLVRVLL
jgi:hypothetical protein